MELLAALGMIGFSVFQQVKAQEEANEAITGGENGEQSESEAS
jgi:hypothetical protein